LNTAIEEPTVIYATTKDMHPTWYPNGYNVFVNGTAVEHTQDSPFLELHFSDPIYNDNVVTIRLEPK